MASLIEAIEIKRKMFFEYREGVVPLPGGRGVEADRPGGQTLVRLKMRNLLTRAVFDRTFKAGDKFGEPSSLKAPATFLYADADGFHFMDQECSSRGLTLSADQTGEDRFLLVQVDNLEIA